MAPSVIPGGLPSRVTHGNGSPVLRPHNTPWHQQNQGADSPLYTPGGVNSSQCGKTCLKRHICLHQKCKKISQLSVQY